MIDNKQAVTLLLPFSLVFDISIIHFCPVTQSFEINYVLPVVALLRQLLPQSREQFQSAKSLISISSN